jgi:hypothetical protein
LQVEYLFSESGSRGGMCAIRGRKSLGTFIWWDASGCFEISKVLDR